jgi:arylsulfatase
MPAQAVVGQFLQSFREFPPSQKPGTFSVGEALEALQSGAAGPGK